MKNILRGLHAELLKLKGTLALALCFVAPLTVITLNTLMALTRTPSSSNGIQQIDFAQWAMIQCSFWSILMLPLFITLQSALLAGVEHSNQQWKNLLALPIPKPVHFISKWLILWLMNALATLVLMLMIPASGFLLDAASDTIELTGKVPVAKLALLSLQLCITSSLMLGIQTLIALRWRSFTVASASGMVATVAGFLIAQSSRFGHYYPWALPVQLFTNPPAHLESALWFGGVGGFVSLVAGAWYFKHREMH
jgi:lantibiotic transport system permease protein